MNFTYHKLFATPFPIESGHVSVCHEWVAIPFVRKSIGIWSLKGLSSQALELEGHTSRVQLLRFSTGTSHPTLLASACRDYLIIWDIEQCQEDSESGKSVRGLIISSLGGLTISDGSFSPGCDHLALCIDRNVHVWNIKTKAEIAVLEGHSSLVTGVSFIPHSPSCVVSIGEDRTFKVWDLEQGGLLYQSPIVSSSPFISIAMNPASEEMALGSADGVVRFYCLGGLHGFKLLRSLDVMQVKRKLGQESNIDEDDGAPLVISSKPSWQQQQPQQTAPERLAMMSLDGSGLHLPEPILTLGFLLLSPPAGDPGAGDGLRMPGEQNGEIRNLLEKTLTLFVTTPGFVLTINADILEVIGSYPFSGASFLQSEGEQAISYCSMHSNIDRDRMWMVLGEMDSKVTHVVSFAPSAPVDGTDRINTDSLSVISSQPLLPCSPLRGELTPKQATPLKGQMKGQKTPKGKLDKGKSDKPLVFHDKIKSSGYATPAKPRAMFAPNTGKSKPKPKTVGSSGVTGSNSKEYPMNCGVPSRVVAHVPVDAKPTMVTATAFSPSGQYVACSASNGSAHVFKMPLTGKGISLGGHSSSVNHIHWSRDSDWLITSADDATARVWQRNGGGTDPVMVISAVIGNIPSQKDKEPKIKSEVFSKPVKWARFYYMDKFILLSSGNSFYLYKYHLDPAKSDVKRYLSKSCYKLVCKKSLAKAPVEITSLSAVNSFYSYMVLASGSDRSLEVHDMNTNQVVQTYDDTHTRAPYLIVQNEGSPFSSLPTEAYNLFLTAAVTDCIKLWDIRTNRCVRRYEAHTNRVHPCKASFSPCSRFIVTGSEDRAVYVYDLASGQVAEKIGGMSDTVTATAYHPLYPELIVGTLDGTVKLYAA